MPDTCQNFDYVQYAASDAVSAQAALQDVLTNVSLEQTCFVLLFVPNRFDPEELCKALPQAFRHVPVFGCTTAGQICGHGYDTDSLLMIAFPRLHFRCASILFEDLDALNIGNIAVATERYSRTFRHTPGWGRFALLFADGLSKTEDILVATLDAVLDELPVFGGSAGDGLEFESTFVIHDHQLLTNSAVLLFIETRLGFRGLNFDHFLPTDTQVVITKADPDKRIVYEINGAPAAPEYARLVGCDPDRLGADVFAENPLLILSRTNHYVRAIQDVGENGALSFMAAIDDGLIMTLGHGRDVVETLEAELSQAKDGETEPCFILGFDCVLRKLEFEKRQLIAVTSGVLQRHRVLGFNTYGEQNRGVHMNQTFVGIAFYAPDRLLEQGVAV